MRAVQREQPDPYLASLELVGSARDILFVGDVREKLLEALDARGCSIVCVVIGDAHEDEARVFCSTVEKGSADTTGFSDAIRSLTFDAVVFDGSIELLRDPSSVLAEARAMLRQGGFVVATVPNIRYGAVRLALIGGTQVDSSEDVRALGFTHRGVEDLFVGTGYAIERFESLRRPIFSSSTVSRDDFPAAVVDAIEQDPEADVCEFLVRAHRLGDSVAAGQAPPSTEEAASSNALELARTPPPYEEIVANLERDLEDERAGRERLLAALTEAQGAATALELRIAELAARRHDREETASEGLRERAKLQTTLDEEIRNTAELRRQLIDARDRSQNLEERLRQIGDNGEAGEERDRATRLKLQIALGIARIALQKIAEDVSRSEDDWAALYRELEDTRERSEELTQGFRDSLESTRRERDRARAEAAQRSEHVAALLSQVAEKDEQAGAASLYARHLEGELDTLRQAALAQRETETALRDRLVEAERRLVLQTEEYVAAMQAESAQLATMVDVVQSSHFWKIKRWLSRLWSRTPGF
jgi:SAM-dependent methyltransferase